MSVEEILKKYKITDYIKCEEIDGQISLIDIPMMSDIEWQLMCLKDRIENPKKYEGFEDLQSSIKKIKTWLHNNCKINNTYEEDIERI